MLPKKEVSTGKDVKEGLQQSTSYSSWNVIKESTSRNIDISLPKTKEGNAFRQAILRYEGGERGNRSNNFSPEDAGALVKDIKDANITSKDINEAIKYIKKEFPDIFARERAIKYLADAMTDEENLSQAHKEAEVAFSEACLDDCWEKIKEKLPENPVLQVALEYALKEKTGTHHSIQDNRTANEQITDNLRQDSQEKLSKRDSLRDALGRNDEEKRKIYSMANTVVGVRTWGYSGGSGAQIGETLSRSLNIVKDFVSYDKGKLKDIKKAIDEIEDYKEEDYKYNSKFVKDAVKSIKSAKEEVSKKFSW